MDKKLIKTHENMEKNSNIYVCVCIIYFVTFCTNVPNLKTR